jgi:hypothetical protein
MPPVGEGAAAAAVSMFGATEESMLKDSAPEWCGCGGVETGRRGELGGLGAGGFPVVSCCGVMRCGSVWRMVHMLVLLPAALIA